ncbi:hypothetical protein V6N12_035350 [Hibiscus sabdariffa]|uniref:Uncharacterized protein n=1 Tax=Hibiscus sabdariffa TaxID=183260 RepID=A0ABR2BST0_9ROSI
MFLSHPQVHDDDFLVLNIPSQHSETVSPSAQHSEPVHSEHSIPVFSDHSEHVNSELVPTSDPVLNSEPNLSSETAILDFELVASTGNLNSQSEVLSRVRSFEV